MSLNNPVLQSRPTLFRVLAVLGIYIDTKKGRPARLTIFIYSIAVIFFIKISITTIETVLLITITVSSIVSVF